MRWRGPEASAEPRTRHRFDSKTPSIQPVNLDCSERGRRTRIVPPCQDEKPRGGSQYVFRTSNGAAACAVRIRRATPEPAGTSPRDRPLRTARGAVEPE